MIADSLLQITITARRSTTVLPRCLQILSRRSYILTGLRSTWPDDSTIVMECTLTGPERWHAAVVSLLERVIDVQAVTTVSLAKTRQDS
jgi:acetolactate synthase regulatory subunit